MNFRPWLSLPLVAVLASASAPAQAADPVSVRQDALESLRAGLSFVELSLLADPPRLTPDFIFAAIDSGEVTLDVLVNRLLASAADVSDPRRDVLRDAIDLLIGSTRKVSASGETPAHLVLRGRLLLAAARLQDAYQVEVAGLQDAAAGALPDAASLPDWRLPAGMVLRRIGGGARINTLTGAYSANLSGELLLPGIDAALSVPRASIDSRGNLDLTAHGAITLPPGDPRGILLSVPARTPLNFHVGEDGDFRASGGVRLTLPEDIKLDAFFDIDDPDYVFSLGYSGGVTLDLAREIHTIRPTVNFAAAQPLALDALSGFAQFFGSYNAGLETLLREEPSLPDPAAIELGQAPEFETPETTLPFDVLDAWLTAIGNDFVRPAVNGTVDASLEPARSILTSMRNEVAAVRADIEPKATDIRSLSRMVDAITDARRRIGRAAEVSELTSVQSERLLDLTASALRDAAEKAQAWLNNLPPGTDIKTLLAACKLLSDATANASVAGVSPLPDLSIIAPKLTQARNSLLASNGFAPTGSVADVAKAAARSHEDLLVLVFALLEIDALAQNAGVSVDGIQPARVLTRRWFVKIRDSRLQAIESADMLQELETSAWLAWSMLLHDRLGLLDGPASPEKPTPDEVDLMAFSLPDTHASIVARKGGSALARQSAGSLILAATKLQESRLERVRERRTALFDEQITKSSAKDPEGLTLAEISYLNMVRDVTRLMQGRGLLTAAALSGYKEALTDHLDYFRTDRARRSPQTFTVEDNLAAATRDLQQLTEGLVFLHSFMPEKGQLIGEFTQSWQALRVPWTAVTEAQKAHWYLTAYVRELDRMATRYGVDLAGAFGLSLRTSAMEAMAGLNRVTNSMNGLLATLGTEDVAFPLPGDLKINSAFGKVAFNRVTGDWTLGFGGGIEFPESEFALDVFDATLSKNGAFSLNVGTRGEVPLGGEGSKMKFVVPQFAVNGSTTQQQLAFNTDGTLTYDPTTAASDEFSLNLRLNYDSQTGLVGLDAGLNNSPVRFSEDLVFLDGAVGLDFSSQNPEGALELAGTFGVMARKKPLPAGALQADDFWLTLSVAPTRFNFTQEAMTAEITGGSITLPADLFSSQAQPNAPPVSVAITSPLCLRYEFASGALSFCNPAGQPFTADLTNFKLALAELPGFELAIASARLELNGSEFPLLRNLNAAVTVPLPGADATNATRNTSATFNVSAQNWRIDGLPEAASIGIAQNLRLADFNGFTLDLLGGSAFSLAATPGFPRTLTLGLSGGMRAGFDERVLRNNATGNAVFLTGNGALSWDMQSLPVLQNLDLTLEGNFRLGADGPAITGLEDNTLARLEFQNFGGLFNQLAAPVIITVEGAIDIPDAVKFGLVSTRFILRGNGLEFEPGGVQTELRGQTLELAKDVLPVYLSKIRLEFKDPHPLMPAAPGGPALFDLTNLKLVLSGGANIPFGAALDSGVPGLSGEVRDLEVSLRLDGQGKLLPEFNLDAIALQVENLTIPPLAELKGGIALVNLDQLSLDPPRPERVTFVGELGGSFNGTGVGALVASSATEFHGLALTASAGSVPVGIPLDGYVLGGILWNGATGGIHFKNSFDDPTEFSTYLQRDPEGRITGANEFPPPGNPGANPTNISDPFDELEGGDDLYTKSDLPKTPAGFDPFDMLQDNWPPRAANPLLEEFPAKSGRLVFKASRLTTAQADDFLDRIGLTEGDTRDMEQIIAVFLTEMTDDIRTQGDSTVLALITASNVAGNQALATHYQELSDKLADSFDDAARPVLRQILQSALQAGTSLRAPLRDLLTSGIPGFNVTFLGSGTFTHTALAPVMDLKGTISASTTGAALSRGELRISGIPVAEASVGFSLTNEEGDISPFLGGLARVGIGPLEFGKLTMSASLPDAAAVVGHFDTFLQCSLSTLGAGAQAQFEIIAENAIGAQVPVGTALQDFLLARDDSEKLAVAGALFDYFARTAEGTLPEQFALVGDDFNSLLNCFAVFVSSALNSFTPEIGFGGKIQPSLFDIPMTASGMPLASARMRFGPVLRTPNGSESLIDLLGNPAANLAPGSLPGVREFSAYAQFSPTAMILSPISGTFVALNPSNAAFVGFTALDSAELGFSSQIEEWTPEKVLIFLTNPPQYFADRTEEFFNTAVLGAGYKMSPFGMNLADGQLRVVFPDSILHPRRPGGINAARLGNPIRPFDSNGTRTLPLPSTDELILAALTAGKIKDATFRGGLNELDDLFPPPPAEPASDGNLRKVHEISSRMRALNDPTLSLLQSKSFAKDYFPYGGIIGGGQLALPQLLTRGLPPNWGDLFTKQGAEWLQSFGSVATFLASTDSVGQLAYYVPAPNPILFDAEEQALEGLTPAEREAAIALIWENMTIDDLLRRLQMDPAALVGRSINTNLYEVNEINLAGWAKANLLGIPLGEARLGYDGASRRLLATAQLPPNTANDGNWFNDFLSGQAQFSIQLPSDQQTGLVTYGAAELFSLIQRNITSGIPDPDPENPGEFLPPINSLSGPDLEQRIAQIQNSLKGALPRISAEINSGVTIPATFRDFVRGGAQVGFFAYSPYFQPDFEPANDRPKAIAKRRGGVGVSGSLDIGYFSPDENPANDVFLTVSDASLALSIPTGPGFPGLSGNFELSAGTLPVPLGEVGATSLTNLRITLNTDPAVGENFLLVSGQTPAVNLGDFMRIDPLSGANISADFIVNRTTEFGPPSVNLALSPAKVTFPGLADNTLDLRIHGTGGIDEDFTLSTSGDFGGMVTLSGGITLKDPLTGVPVITLASPSPLTGSIARNASITSVSMAIPPGISATLHPVNQLFTLDAGATLVMRSNGTFEIQLNAAPMNFDVMEIRGLQAGGRLAVSISDQGFSIPSGAQLRFLGVSQSALTLESFSIATNGAIDVRVTSTGSLEVPDFFRLEQPPGGTSEFRLQRSAAGVAKLRVAAPRLVLFPGANGLQKTTIALPDLIEIESSGRFYVNTGSRTLDLLGAVQASGNLEFGYEPTPPNAIFAFTTSTTSRAFGLAIRGRATTLPLTITNTGTARLPLALELSGTGADNYHLSHSSLSLAQGTNQIVNITFISKGNSNSATLTLRPLNGSAPAQTVSLVGGTTAGTTSLAELVRSESSLSFGQFATGLTEARSALLMNTGVAAVSVDSVSVPAGMALQATATGTLLPGETRVVPIIYQPTASGTTSGSLSYATTPGTQSASLTGTVVNRNFIKIFNGGTSPFVSLSMSGDSGIAVDRDGRTWRTTNQGATWKPEAIQSLPVTTSLQPKVLTTNSGTNQFKWLVGSAGEYWQARITATDTNGWTKDITPAVSNPNRNWKSIARQSNVGTPLALVAGNEGSTGIILRETAPGKFSEIPLPSTNLRSITTNTGDLTALAIADAGKLFRSTDGGTTFAQVGIGTSGNLLAADISTTTGSAGARTAVIGASGGTIFRSANSGASWTAASISAPGFILGDIVSVAIEGTRGLAVDSKGVLLTTSNSGATWTAGEQGFTRSRINTISRSGSDFWALTENGEIHYRIPEGGLLTPPITLLDDFLSLGAIPTTSPGPHLRSTGITNVGNTTLNLTFTPSGSNVTVTPSSVSVAPGQTVGVRLGLTTTATPGFASGSISITAAGFAKNLTLSIAGTVQARTWTVGNRFTTSNLIDVETRSELTRNALSSTHFYQTLNRGSTWTERVLPNSLARAMFFTSSTTGLVVGGTVSRGFILRTTDSGASWSTAYSETRTTAFPGRAVTDVHLRTSNVGYAVTSSGSTSGFPPTNFRGLLLRTTDAGVTWTSIAGPAADASFSGTSVHAVSDTSVFVASGSVLWNYNFTTNTWTSVRNFGSFINRVRFAPDNLTGWVVGVNMLFGVTTTGGATSGSWGPFLELFPSSGNFDDLCFDVTGEARTIRNSTDAMEVWRQGLTGGDIWSRDTFSYAFEATTPRGRAIDMSSAIQGTIVGDGGVVWIYNPTPAVAADRALVTTPVLDFGVRRESSDPLLQNLTVLNPTNATVRINDIIVKNLGTEESFTAALGSVILAAGASTTIPVTFSGLAPGGHEALITVISDSPGGIHTRTRLTATVQTEPAGLVVRTNPPALSLTVGSTTATTTASRVIRDGTAVPGELNVGQSLGLAAQATQTSSGVSYKFSNWTGGAGGTGSSFNHIAGNSSRFAEAVYRPFFPVTTVTIPELAAPTGGTGPNTRPSSGPWVRLTGAKLIVPNLREFAVSGEMFLSGEAIRATLASTAFSVPQNSSAPVLEVGSGSWVLDWTKSGPFRFTSSSPSLKVLNSDLLPSAAASLNFESNGSFGMNFSLPDGFQDVTGMFEIAPNGATPASIGFSFASGQPRFNLNCRLRALSNGQGGWLVDQAVSIPDSNQLFPQTLTLAIEANSSTHINLGAFTIINGSVALTRDDTTGVISLGLNSLNLNGPLGTLTGLSAAASANGTLSITRSGALTLGPFVLTPIGGAISTITLNALTGSLSVDIPQSHLNAASGSAFANRWPADTITIPGLQFDSSGAFDRRIPLPAISIDSIGISAGGDVEQNHIRFKRSRSGTLSVFVRDRQDFLGNTSDLEFEIRNDGFLRGKYYGEMSFLGAQFGTVNMSYDPARAPHQFQGTFSALDNPMLTLNVGFGTGAPFAKPPFVP